MTAQKRQASSRMVETQEQRQIRLQLNDAAQAVSALSFVRRFTQDVGRRHAISREVAKIARAAVEAAEGGRVQRGPFRRVRREAERLEERAKIQLSDLLGLPPPRRTRGRSRSRAGAGRSR